MSRRRSLAAPPARLDAEPDLSRAHKNAVESALRWAWVQLVVANSGVLHTGTEEQITHALEVQLGRRERGRRLAPGLADFEHVSRGAKQETADGGIEKAPDLTFRPPINAYPTVTNTTHWGLFVECKLISDTRPVRLYVQQGVRRFESGEYAPRMPSGMMLAYVRNGTMPAAELTPHFPTLETTATDDVCISTHPRAALANPCVDITLVHLWLPVV